MADREKKARRVEELVELSRHLDADDMLRNLQEEMRRMEEGLGHTIWDAEMRRVTQCPNPLPVTPKFETLESDDELKVKVRLPRVPEDNIILNVTPSGLEVYAKLDERICKPYFLSVEVAGTLKPETAVSRVLDGTLEVSVKKAKRVRVKVR